MYTENNLCEIVRSVAGDLVEETKLIDDFTHPKTVRPQLICLAPVLPPASRQAMAACLMLESIS